MRLHRLFVPSALVALSVCIVACVDEVPVENDGGVDGAVDGAAPGTGPMPPEAPVLPNFGVCPAGWRSESTADGFDVCQPFPESGRSACSRDEAFFPGTSACAPIGTSCPTGDFPVDLPTDTAVLYVLAGAASGDGTEASPFGTINEAAAVAAAGTVIAVGKGRYAEAVTVPGGVSLVGACVAETVLTFDGSSYSAGVVNAGGADVSIRNLRVAESARPGIMVVGEGKSATIEDVVIHDCAVGGISVESGAVLTGERIVVRDPRSVEVLSALGRGLNVETGAEATVRWLHVEGAKEAAVIVLLGGDLTLEDATLVDTQLASATAAVGAGLMAGDGGHLAANRVVVEEATAVGLLVQNEATDAAVTDLVVRRTRPKSPSTGARGIDVNEFAALRCTRCLVEDVTEWGVAGIAAASVTLTDTLVRRVGPRVGDGRFGRGLSLQTAAQLHVERVMVVDVPEQGVAVDGEGSRLSGGDLVIRRVTGTVDAGDFGRGITFQSGARGELARVEIGHVTETGVACMELGTADVTDLFIHDVVGRPVDGRFGRGATLQGGSSLTLTRARIERVRDFGLGALGVGAEVTATDLSVSDITRQDCFDAVCSTEPGGHGIGSYFGARVSVRRFGVQGASLCGVQVADDATLSLRDGIVRDALIGACLQSDAQEIRELQNEVRYVDNGANFEATMLPVPAPLDSVE